MNERAVVAPTCIWCGETMTANEDLGDWLCVCGRTGDDMETARMPLPPRALVAISEDRQWLVVHVPSFKSVADLGWGVFEAQGCHTCFELAEWMKDTGQSADDVLREWMEEREA